MDDVVRAFGEAPDRVEVVLEHRHAGRGRRTSHLDAMPPMVEHVPRDEHPIELDVGQVTDRFAHQGVPR
jgi:hypothetical protein